MCCVALARPAWAQSADDDNDHGRDFPKTLIFDEPGIDDEISLPTLSFMPGVAPVASQTDLDFELDKRLTTRLSVQINIGYSALSTPYGATLTGWQNTDATLKFVAYADPAAEQLVSLSLIREFGASGAARVGADPVGATTLAVNFGQGFARLAPVPMLQPFAITGSAGYALADTARNGSGRQMLLSGSLQYSLDVLMSRPAGAALPGFLRPLIPIVECVYENPVGGGGKRYGILAPGLIYAGRGYQLAAEALRPLTGRAGTGFIAQLNISLSLLGDTALARPLF